MYKKKNELKKELFDFKEEFWGNIFTPALVISYGKKEWLEGGAKIPEGGAKDQDVWWVRESPPEAGLLDFSVGALVTVWVLCLPHPVLTGSVCVVFLS